MERRERKGKRKKNERLERRKEERERNKRESERERERERERRECIRLATPKSPGAKPTHMLLDLATFERLHTVQRTTFLSLIILILDILIYELC